MSNTTFKKSVVKPGDVVHYVASKNVAQTTDFLAARPALGMVYGTELTLTTDIIEANKDRNGHSQFDYLDDEDAQIAKWGRVVMRRGPWPPDRLRTLPGSEARYLQRQIAIDAAWQEPDPAKRSQLIREANEKFGPGPASRNTTHYYGGFRGGERNDSTDLI